MHEGSVCREIMNIVSESALQNNISHVYEIILRVGPYSCIHEQQLNFYFDVLGKGTCMENAKKKKKKDDSISGASQMFIKSYKGE